MHVVVTRLNWEESVSLRSGVRKMAIGKNVGNFIQASDGGGGVGGGGSRLTKLTAKAPGNGN